METLGFVPRIAPASVARAIEALWARRNVCPESEVEKIDREMEATLRAHLVQAG